MPTVNNSTQARTFTQANQVRGLKPEAKPFEARDALSPKHKGLALRVQPTGNKSWWFVYKLGGTRYRLSIGEYPSVDLSTARNCADRWRVMLKDESQPNPHEVIKQQARDKAAQEARDALESHRDDWTVRRLSELFLAALKKEKRRPRTIATYARLLENFAHPVIGDMPAHEVTWSDIEDVLDRAKKRASTGGPAITQSNLTHSVLSAMFSWAIGTRKNTLAVTPPKHLRGLANPVATVHKAETKRKQKRALTDAEASALWAALKDEKGAAADALALIMLTGCRLDETIRAEWKHVDLEAEQPTWTIPAHVTKNRTEHIVLLSEQSVERLKSSTSEHEGCVFPSIKPANGREKSATHVGESTMRRHLKALLERTGQDPTISTHYFRHTLATFVSTHYGNVVRRRVLNHKTKDAMEAVYDHSTYDDKARDAWQAWGRKLDALADPTINVVTLGGRSHG